MKKYQRLFALAMLFLFMYTGCSASKNSNYVTSSASTVYDGASNSIGAESIKDNAALYKPSDSRKMIKNASVEMEATDFDASVESLYKLITDFGGYIEGSNVSGSAQSYNARSGNYTVRIPADKLESFLSAQSDIGNVLNTNIWQEDVTDQYTDNEARIATLTTKKERLLALLEKATDLKDIIELENALSNTIYELELVTGGQNKLDNRISYSSVTVSICEVVTETEKTPKTLGERISNEFSRTLRSLKIFAENFLVFVAGNSPVLVILLLIVLIILFIVRKSVKKSEKSRIERLDAYNKMREAEKACADAQNRAENQNK